MLNTLSTQEYAGWVSYLSTSKPADAQEIQMAMLLTMVSGYMGGKNTLEDFIVSGKKARKSKEPERTPFDVFNAFATDMV